MVHLDGRSLTLPEVERVAGGDVEVVVGPAAHARVAAAAARADAVVARREVYGRSTGVGANRTVVLAPPVPGVPDLAATMLLRSHATSAGPLRSAARTRAALAVRLNQLLAGGSGASPVAVDALAALVASGAVPPVRELGGVGTGDLAAFATVALVLSGELAPTSGTAPPPVHLGLGDALPLLSSGAATLADAALGLVPLTRLAHRALAVAATSFVGVAGNGEAFSRSVETVTPFSGAREVARTMRGLVAGAGPAARIQDPFAMRTLPQVHGPLLDALAAATDVVTRLVNAPGENPVYLPDDEVAHHGGFHLAYLTQALDAVRIALLGAARLSLGRLGMLCDPHLTGLPAFLADGRAGANGVLLLEYVAGSALGTLQGLAAQAGLGTVSLSLGVEEDASSATQGARRLLDAVAPFRTVVAAEWLAAGRALRMEERAVPGVLEDDVAALLAVVDPDVTDRDLSPDLARVEQVLEPLPEHLAGPVR